MKNVQLSLAKRMQRRRTVKVIIKAYLAGGELRTSLNAGNEKTEKPMKSNEALIKTVVKKSEENKEHVSASPSLRHSKTEVTLSEMKDATKDADKSKADDREDEEVKQKLLNVENLNHIEDDDHEIRSSQSFLTTSHDQIEKPKIENLSENLRKDVGVIDNQAYQKHKELISQSPRSQDNNKLGSIFRSLLQIAHPDNILEADNTYEVSILIIYLKEFQKGKFFLTAAMGEIIRHKNYFNNWFSINDLIFDSRLSFEDRIFFEKEFVSKCITISSNKEVIYNQPNAECNKYAFEYLNKKFKFDEVYRTTDIINFRNFTDAKLIYSSSGNEVISKDNLIFVEYLDNYKIYETQQELLRKMVSLSVCYEEEMLFLVVIREREFLDKRVFEKMFKKSLRNGRMIFMVYYLTQNKLFFNREKL
jgi:hypothetical protein